MSMIAVNNWECKIKDIETAFLQGTPLMQNLFLKPPKVAQTDNLWKLNKCIYGLNEFSRHW